MNQRRHCADTWRACVNRVWRHQHPPPIVIGHGRASHSISRKLCWQNLQKRSANFIALQGDLFPNHDPL